MNHPARDPDDLRHRRRARARQRLRRDDLPAQHRPRRHPRPGAGRAEIGAGHRRPRSGPPASRGTSRRACASPATSGGAAPTRASARTRRWSSKMETIIDGLQGRGPTAHRPGPRARHRQALRRRRRHRVRHGHAASNVGKPWYEQRYTIDQGITVTNRQDFAAIDLAPYGPAIRHHDVGQRHAVVLQRRLDRGRRRQPDQDARQPRADHRRAQGRARLRRLRHLRLGGHPPDPRPGQPHQRRAHRLQGAGRRQRRHRHVHGAVHRRRSSRSCCWPRCNAGRVSQARIDDAVRAHPAQASSSSGLFEHPFASTDNVDEVGSAAHRALARRGRRRVAGAAEEQRRTCCRWRRDAHIYVAGRNADNIGNQAGGWTIQWQGVSGDGVIPGTTILDGHPRGRAERHGHVQRGRVGAHDRPGRRRRRRRRDAVRRGLRRRRRTGVRLLHARPSSRRSRCRSSRATRRSSTRCAPRSRRASCWSSPAVRRC